MWSSGNCANNLNLALRKKMVYTQPWICPRKWDEQTSLEFWDTNWSHNLGLTTRPRDSQKKKKEKKKKLSNSVLCRSGWPQGKTEEKGKERWTLPENRKIYGTWYDGNTNCDWCTRYGHQKIGTKLVQGLQDMEIRGWAETIEITALSRSVRIQASFIRQFSLA